MREMWFESVDERIFKFKDSLGILRSKITLKGYRNELRWVFSYRESLEPLELIS